ncbi:unnamed protein product [Linum trigynum]|uniref:Uncharacterized protein n=1 Tax=Linum trigynum TaxID=586398 RepID=A0AAV2CVA4_9ROSI
MRRTWCHEVVAFSGPGSHQAVEGEIKTSSWFMEAKARASTPSSHDRATRLNTTTTLHRGHQVPTSPKTGQGPPRRRLPTSHQGGTREPEAVWSKRTASSYYGGYQDSYTRWL